MIYIFHALGAGAMLEKSAVTGRFEAWFLGDTLLRVFQGSLICAAKLP